MLTLLSSQVEPGYGHLAALLAMAGLSKSVLMRKFRIPHLLLFQRKNQERRVAPAPYVPDKIWKVILRFNTSNTVQLDPEYKKYYQH